MKLKRLLVAAVLATSSLNSWSSLSASANQAVARVRDVCGFELPEQFLLSAHSSITGMRAESFQVEFDLKPRKWTASAKVNVIFNCSKPGTTMSEAKGSASGAEPDASVAAATRVSARAIVEAEDAGGRYARHVAAERPIIAKNWRGTVAYVDGVFGDGQRSKMTMLLACDDAASRSCIELHVDPPIPLRGQGLEALLELIRTISHVQR